MQNIDKVVRERNISTHKKNPETVRYRFSRFPRYNCVGQEKAERERESHESWGQAEDAAEVRGKPGKITQGKPLQTAAENPNKKKVTL